MKQLSAPELARWLADPKRPPPLLLDIREPWEAAIARIEGSELVPMRELPERLASLDLDQEVVCICHHGGRSLHVAMWLERQGHERIWNLAGGIDAWARQVDPATPIY